MCHFEMNKNFTFLASNVKVGLDKVSLTLPWSNTGCQIGQFIANFEKFGHILTALTMKKSIWPFFRIVTLKLSFH